MAIRGRLAVNDSGYLVMIDPNASDPSNPTSSEINPVKIEELNANTDLIDAAGISHTGELADAADTGVDIEDDGSVIISAATAINLASQLNASDDGDGTVTVAPDSDHVEDATTTGNAPYEIQKDGTDGTGIINFKTV